MTGQTRITMRPCCTWPVAAGHGYVHPFDDGRKARCGGPAICSTCAAEAVTHRAGPWLDLRKP